MKYSAILAVSAGLALPAAASRLAIRQEVAVEGQAVNCTTTPSCTGAEDIQGRCEVENEGNFPKQADCICQSEFFNRWIECRKCTHVNQPRHFAHYTLKLDNTKRAFCAGTADKKFAVYFEEAAPLGEPGSGGQGAAGLPGSGGQGAAGLPGSGGQGGSAGLPGSGGQGGAAGQSSTPAAPTVTASTSSQGGSGGAGSPVVGSTATQQSTPATATPGAGGAGAAAGAGGNNTTSTSTTRGAGGSGTSGAPGSRSTTGIVTGAAAPKTVAVGSAVLMAFAGVAMMVL